MSLHALSPDENETGRSMKTIREAQPQGRVMINIRPTACKMLMACKMRANHSVMHDGIQER